MEDKTTYVVAFESYEENTSILIVWKLTEYNHADNMDFRVDLVSFGMTKLHLRKRLHISENEGYFLCFAFK
ncbi:unnamed protein product [Lactuca virosa]|uniref:Uncharacterized protein n=1 Tax=Lactuca virosa TaxID=75947 RepID=A0AAU9NSU1_9ASTR|nr:unnamed protein product [Lactuca virosa]